MKSFEGWILLDPHEQCNAQLSSGLLPLRDALLIAEELDEEARLEAEFSNRTVVTLEDMLSVVRKHITAEQIRTFADLELGLEQ